MDIVTVKPYRGDDPLLRLAVMQHPRFLKAIFVPCQTAADNDITPYDRCDPLRQFRSVCLQAVRENEYPLEIIMIKLFGNTDPVLKGPFVVDPLAYVIFESCRCELHYRNNYRLIIHCILENLSARRST